MHQFHRSGGVDVYTAVAGVAEALVLLAGCMIMVMHNIQYSSSSATSDDGGIFKILETRWQFLHPQIHSRHRQGRCRCRMMNPRP